MQENEQQVSSAYMIGGAIIVAGLIVAGAIVYANPSLGGGQLAGAGEVLGGSGQVNNKIEVKPVTAEDHIMGDPEAPVKLIEFSDFDCPFCTIFHETIDNYLIDEYINTGKVALVYRHFPIDSLHPEARVKAQASECVASLADSESFWNFVDYLFTNDETANDLVDIVATYGISESDFGACLNDPKTAAAVGDDLVDGQTAGGQGTPYSVVIAQDGSMSVIPGALPVKQVRTILDAALEK